ncbi:probable disease resistance protein At4g14610 [Hevea brasiliensis]|uniref:probable disease resistance protein At4g14610 n=1 Tax=Hevea brasiliensis TaxID=3981 RepID=UPI0025E2A7CC|nr:probable disease resistance protein At4g14610 [Hevea brasiliensis]
MEAKRMIKVKPLDWEEAWALFQVKVECIDHDILPVSRNVAKECRGLPITLITIGRAMANRNTVEEWEHALEVLRSSASSLQGMEDEVFQDVEVEAFARLMFSYDSLHSDKVKSCFLYCSLFPEDFQILKDDLVHYWISESFCAHNEVYFIIGSLVGACLLEEKGRLVKMHDVIRDMTMWIACKCEKEKHKFFVKASAQLIEVPEVGLWEGSEQSSLMANSLKRINETPTCPDLLTLFLSHNRRLCKISNGFFQFMHTLTVLDLSNTGVEELPVGISKLNSWQYLNLSRTYIGQLPVQLKMSTSSQHLWFANMKNLAILHIFCKSHSKGLGVDVVMEETETHNVAGGLGISISRETCFNSLHTLILLGNFRLRDLTWLILAPNLMLLRVFNNKHIEEIISVEKLDDFRVGVENLNLFSKLEVLELEALPELKSIYPKALSFLFLEKMEVYRCPKLKKLPLNSSSAIGCKFVIKAQDHFLKNVEWDDDSTKTIFCPV